MILNYLIIIFPIFLLFTFKRYTDCFIEKICWKSVLKFWLYSLSLLFYTIVCFLLLPFALLSLLLVFLNYGKLYFPKLPANSIFMLGVFGVISASSAVPPMLEKEIAFPDTSYVPMIKISGVDTFVLQGGIRLRVLYSEQEENVLARNVSQMMLGGGDNLYELLAKHPLNTIKIDLSNGYGYQFLPEEFSLFKNSICLSAYTHSSRFIENTQLTTDFDLLGKKRSQFSTPFYLQEEGLVTSLYKSHYHIPTSVKSDTIVFVKPLCANLKQNTVLVTGRSQFLGNTQMDLIKSGGESIMAMFKANRLITPQSLASLLKKNIVT